MELPPHLESIRDALTHKFSSLKSNFQRIESQLDEAKKKKMLESVTVVLRECKTLVQDFEREMKLEQASSPPGVSRSLQEHKSALVKELNSFIVLRKEYGRALHEGLKIHLSSEGGLHAEIEGSTRLATAMTNTELVSEGHSLMAKSDMAIKRSKKTLENTINIGAETAVTLKEQTDQMEKIVDNLDTLQFSLAKATKLIRVLGRQLATDKCIMFMLGLVALGVVAIIIVKIVENHGHASAPSPSAQVS